jgi:periplasmic protein TonB
VITHNIKWFLCLSTAAHAAVLTAWQLPDYMPGSSGHAVHLTITQRAGDRIEQPSTLTAPAATAAVENTPRTQQAEAPAARVASNSATARNTAATPEKTVPQQALSSAQPVNTTAATSAAAASDAVFQQQETDRHLRNSVMQLISHELHYPAIARRKGWQGVVKLNLHIEPDGSITGLQVDETSGYAILDEAALECLQLASLPGAAHWLQGQAIDIVVPVEYRLIDS